MDRDLEYKIAEWYQLKDEIQIFRDTKMAREMELRKEISLRLFPLPIEGTNSMAMPEGWTMKMQYKLDRKVDDEKLKQMKIEMMGKFQIDADRFLRYKTEVQVKEYRTLTEEQRKVFDTALEIKPESPILDLVPPKEK